MFSARKIMEADRAKFGNWQTILDRISFDLISSNALKTFSLCLDDRERLKFLIGENALSDKKCITSYFDKCRLCKPSKSTEESVKARTEGNVLFQQRKYKNAAEYYNKNAHPIAICRKTRIYLNFASMFKAEIPSKEYGTALANRSAALFYLEDYRSCLVDSGLAMKYGYPKPMHYKVLMRRAHCFQYLREQENANAEFEKALQAIDDAEVSKDRKDKLRQELTKLQQASIVPINSTDDGQAKHDVPDVSYGSNQVILQASQCLEMRCNESQGRYLVASQDIKAGDTLIVEKPFAAVLLPDHYLTHCQHCYGKLSQTYYPCQGCTSVRYCSDVCRVDSWNSYHQIECPYQDLLFSVGIAALSMRVVLTAGFQFLCDFRNSLPTLNATERVAGMTENGKYERNYLSVYDLMTHSKDMLAEDLLQYSLTALLLLKCLKHGKFFNSSDAIPNTLGNYTEDEIYIGSLLLRHILQLVCNAHAITALQTSQVDLSRIDTLNQVRIATAIYPTTSLMNHSCDPTIISSFHKNTLIVRAVKDVKSGGEVFNCYGPHCNRMERSSRKQTLKDQYFFDCRCDACLVDADKDEIYMALKCPHCSGPLVNPGEPMVSQCLDCGMDTDVSQMLKSVREDDRECQAALEVLNNGSYRDAINTLKKSLKVKEKLLYKYNKDLGMTFDMIGQCYAAVGEYEESARHVAKSLVITEQIYGSGSIETAHELRKLAAIQFNALASDSFSSSLASSTKTNAMRTLDIYTLCYGEGHADVLELQEFLLNLEQMVSSQGEQ